MKKMCALNEDLFRKSNLDIPDGPVKVDGATNPVYTDALNQHAKRKKDIEKIMKDADKVDELEKPFTGSTDKKNMPKKVEEPKMKLDECLFEDVNEEDTPKKSKKGKRSVEDTYTQIYKELCGGIKGNEAKNRRFKVSNKERYDTDELAYGDGDWDIVVYADTKEGLDFAKKVAKEYGVKVSDIKEYTSRYASHKFSMQIHTDKPIANESLKPIKESYTEVDTIECGEDVYKVVYGGVDFNKEKLVPVEDKDGNRTKLYFSDMIEFYTWYDKNGNVVHEPSMDESVEPKKLIESNAHSDIARHFNYRIPADALDVLTDLLERVRDIMDEEHELYEAVQIAIDEGLIYNSDIWAIKELYEEARLNDETYEELFNDLYSIASSAEDDE